MEKAEITVNNNVKADAIKTYELFSWHLVEEKNSLAESTLCFERDDSVPYYKELVKLEDKFNQTSSIPMPLIYAVIALAVIYITIMAILVLLDVWKCSKLTAVLSISLPSGLLLLMAFLLSFIRSKQSLSFIQNKNERYKIYEEKVEALKNKKD